MNKVEHLLNTFPSIEELNLNRIQTPITYICAIGFEDRAQAILNEALKTNIKFDKIIAIEYKPFDKRNKLAEFKEKIEEFKIPESSIEFIIYDRFEPEEFLEKLDMVKKSIIPDSHIIVDISAITKLLIVILLQGLIDRKNNLHIVYSEAEIYHPVKEKFNAEKSKYERETESLPIFLTTDVYDIVTTTSLSTTSMQGYPLLMVAFPTFNHCELTALVNEITSQHLILIEGRPHEKQNHWRLEAIKWLNRKIIEHLSSNGNTKGHEKIVSTFDYKETIKVLEEIYQKFKYSRKLIVVPTGSKLQTFGVFILKQMHPDIQIVYPVTKEFTELYTEGAKALWCISFSNFSSSVRRLDEYRKSGLTELSHQIQYSLERNEKGLI